MRDVYIVSAIYCILFVVLTSSANQPTFGFTAEQYGFVHHLLADILFWMGALYISITGTYGAFARQNRFALSQKHPLLNRILSILLLVSPFLAILINARFIFVMLGLLMLSHIQSKVGEEQQINFAQSRALSNFLLIPLFTLALILMTNNGYGVGSVLDWGLVIVE
jgi:hypothetical protein